MRRLIGAGPAKYARPSRFASRPIAAVDPRANSQPDHWQTHSG